MSPVQRLIYEAVNLFSKRENSCAFDDLGPAKEWLGEQDAAVAV
jgi:hypothetical protein